MAGAMGAAADWLATYGDSPDIQALQEQARASNREVQGFVGGKTVWVAPNGAIFGNSSKARKWWNVAKYGTYAFIGWAGGNAAMGALSGGGAGAGAGAGKAAGTGVGLGEQGATTGLAGPIPGMAVVDPMGVYGPASAGIASESAIAGTGKAGGNAAAAAAKAASAAGASKSLADKIADWAKLGLAGAGVVAGIQESRANNRRSEEELALEREKIRQQQERDNEAARQAFESEMVRRAQLEEEQRKKGLADVYRAGWYQNRRPGPFNTYGLNSMSANYMNALAMLEGEGMRRLGQSPRYGTDQFPDLEAPPRRRTYQYPEESA